jgi:hypothetical protein
MSTKKSILKNSKTNKTQKKVTINEDANEAFKEIPQPITPKSKAERWTTRTDEKLAREEIKNKEARFKRARKNIPYSAALLARSKFPHNNENKDVIQIKRHSTIFSEQSKNDKKKSSKKKSGFIPSFVGTIFKRIGLKGGRKTRKNRKK